MTLSVVLIARDEEAVIGRVLEDAATIANELVVLDTGSCDRTVELARHFGATVYHWQWQDDFAAARNQSFAKCTGDWIMWLDADDRIPGPAQARLREMVPRLSEMDADVIVLPYLEDFTDETHSSHSRVVNRARILRRRAGFRWRGRIHEVLELQGARWLWMTEAWIEHRRLPAAIPGKQTRDRRLLENALAAGDRSMHVLLHYGRLLGGTGHAAAALPILDECLAACNDEDDKYGALMAAAGCAAALGQIGSALDYLHIALATDPHRAEAFVRIGQLYASSGRWRAAAPFFRGAIGMAPPRVPSYPPSAYSWEPLTGLAQCVWHLGDKDEALRLIDSAAAIAPHQRSHFADLRQRITHASAGTA